MEGENNLMRKREARRQRILQNAQKRFDKLKGVENKAAVVVSEGANDDKDSSVVVTSDKAAAGNPLVLLLSYKPPDNIVNIRLVIVTILAVLLPLHNHWQLFGSREISLVTVFLGLEAQYTLAAYSLGWLVACTSNKQLTNHSMVATISSLLHLPPPLIALVYCIVTLVIQVVTDFFWYLFIAVCTMSLDILIM